jgi:hypothetical protein
MNYIATREERYAWHFAKEIETFIMYSILYQIFLKINCLRRLESQKRDKKVSNSSHQSIHNLLHEISARSLKSSIYSSSLSKKCFLWRGKLILSIIIVIVSHSCLFTSITFLNSSAQWDSG